MVAKAFLVPTGPAFVPGAGVPPQLDVAKCDFKFANSSVVSSKRLK
jgi:hypothetical protein